MSHHDRFDAATALGEVRRVERDVRARSRWQGWLWLIVGLIAPAFLIGTLVAEGDWSLFISITFMAVALLAWLWESRQTVISRTGARLDNPLTAAFVTTMIVVTALRIFILPDHLTAANVAVALIPSVPCFIGAWLIFKR